MRRHVPRADRGLPSVGWFIVVLNSLMSIRILYLMLNTWKFVPIRGLTMHEFTEFVR